MKVYNMKSSKGNTIANQFIVDDCRINIDGQVIKGNMFQSYSSNIAFIPCYECRGTIKVYLDFKYWDYSKTTAKYRNIFLNETKKETEQKIKQGIYKLVNLN